MFIGEFGEGFSDHIKKRLLEIGNRCILTRKEIDYCFDLKHVEHIKYDCGTGEDGNLMEYTYGQLVASDGELYYSCQGKDSAEIKQFQAIEGLFDSIEANTECLEDDIKAKKIDDSNIDFLVDNLIEICPPVSPGYLKIISKYRK